MVEECVDVVIREFGLKLKFIMNFLMISGMEYVIDDVIFDGIC